LLFPNKNKHKEDFDEEARVQKGDGQDVGRSHLCYTALICARELSYFSIAFSASWSSFPGALGHSTAACPLHGTWSEGMADQQQGMLRPPVNQCKGPKQKEELVSYFSQTSSNFMPIDLETQESQTAIPTQLRALGLLQEGAGCWIGHLQLDLKQL